MYCVDDYSSDLQDIYNQIVSFELFHNGERTEIESGDAEFARIYATITSTLSKGRLEPAFGVSIHDLTLVEMQQGDWLKIKFNELKEKNGLHFTSLLMRLDNSCYGTNLIREYDGKYDGRCIYLSFDQETNLNQIL